MKHGVTIRLDRPLTEVAELALRAEDLGFDGVWLADHYFQRDAVAALALMAVRTTSIELGTAVVSPFLRHPALLASATASLQEISGGRFILGLGAGGWEFASQLGTAMPRPLGATREAVEIVRGLLAGTANVAGKDFIVTGARLGWPATGAPVYLAARGPKMLQLAGSVSDGVITHGLSLTHIDYVRRQVASGSADRQVAAPVSQPVSQPVSLCLMLDVQIDENRRRAVDELRPRCVTMAGGSYADELIAVYGLDPVDVAALRVAVRSRDNAAATALVTDPMVDAFGIAGPPGHVADRLTELAAVGADEVILSVGVGDLDECTRLLTQLAKAVL